MLGSEWDYSTAMEVEREEGYEEGHGKGLEKGREEGREEGLETAARNALAEGFSIEIVQKITGLDPETIKSLQAGGQ